MTQVSVNEAQEMLPDLIAATQRGEKVIITLDETPVVQIVPVLQSQVIGQVIGQVIKEQGKPVFGSLKGLIKMADDFDEPLEDFAEYM